jgi:cobalt/nickel transport system permease protein
MAAPPQTRSGAAFIAVVVLSWLVACRPPWHVVRDAALLGLSLFLPYFLLVPLMGGGLDPARWWADLPIALNVFVRGIAGILVTVAAVTTLTATDLRDGLAKLPIPRMVSAILVQIVHQTATLGYETRRVAAAMSVRGASGGGVTAWRVLSSLPQVWLPRVILRAERVAAAMEVRGFCEQDLPASDRNPSAWADATALAALLMALALALLLRYGPVA